MCEYKLDYINAQLCIKFVELVQTIEKVMSVAAKCLSYLTTPCMRQFRPISGRLALRTRAGAGMESVHGGCPSSARTSTEFFFSLKTEVFTVNGGYHNQPAAVTVF